MYSACGLKLVPGFCELPGKGSIRPLKLKELLITGQCFDIWAPGLVPE
jgi:hypothetical protein